jgi:hypothetical protein
MAGDPRAWVSQAWGLQEPASKPFVEEKFTTQPINIEEGEVVEGELIALPTLVTDSASPPSLLEDHNQQEDVSTLRSK